MSDQARSLLHGTVSELLDGLAAATAAPGGGGAAALATAMAAGLVAMAGRFAARAGSPEPADFALVARADELRRQAAPLADLDAAAYGDFLAAVRLPRQADPGRREAAVTAALGRAVAVPLRIATIAAEVAGLAARIAASGNPRLRGDAATAALLAGAAARAAAVLVAENLARYPDDPRVAQAASLAAAAGAAADLAGVSDSAAERPEHGGMSGALDVESRHT